MSRCCTHGVVANLALGPDDRCSALEAGVLSASASRELRLPVFSVDMLGLGRSQKPPRRPREREIAVRFHCGPFITTLTARDVCLAVRAVCADARSMKRDPRFMYGQPVW